MILVGPLIAYKFNYLPCNYNVYCGMLESEKMVSADARAD